MGCNVCAFIRINAVSLHGDRHGIPLRTMAALQLKVPEPFDFKKPEEWPRWKKRFEQFRITSGLGEESDQRQVSTLLYCLGEEADDVLSSTNITEAQRRRYTDVLSKFDSFFQVTKNVILEQDRFNRRIQQEGESAEQYIAALYNLAESCEYDTMKSELIRDCLVVSIRDISLSECLQADEKLTLDKARRQYTSSRSYFKVTPRGIP